MIPDQIPLQRALTVATYVVWAVRPETAQVVGEPLGVQLGVLQLALGPPIGHSVRAKLQRGSRQERS